MGKLLYRTARPDDIDALCALEEKCFPEEPWSRQMFTEELENDLALFVVAEHSDDSSDRGVLAGYIIAWVIAPVECQVGSIAVLPEFRRHGIAGSLLEILFDTCRETGTSEVYLEVRVSNDPAIALYKRFGFITDGLRKHYYQDGEDAYTMALKL